MNARRNSRGTLVAALAVALVVAAAGCGGSHSSSADKTQVKIVVEGPMSGDQAATGTDMWNAVRLAAAQANAKGGVDGRTITVIRGDDRADPAAGKQVAKRAKADKAFAVIGPYNSSVGVENLKTYVDAGIIPIHLTSNAATDGLGYTIQPKDYQVAPVEARAITGYFKARNVAIVYDTSTYTAGIAAQVRNALRSAGAQVVLYQSFPEGKPNPAGLVQKIQAAQPDLFYASTYYPEGAAIAKEAAARGVSSTCLMGLANQDAKFVDAGGLAAARRCSFSGVPSAEQFSGARAYVAAYRKRYGVAPGTWGTFAYDSAGLLFSAVRAAGGWNADGVRKQLSKTTDYAGITGTIAIDPKTGARKVVPVVILAVDKQSSFVVDPKWARFAGFSQ